MLMTLRLLLKMQLAMHLTCALNLNSGGLMVPLMIGQAASSWRSGWMRPSGGLRISLRT